MFPFGLPLFVIVITTISLLAAGAVSVNHGDVDALDMGGWRYGCYHDSTFTLFGLDGSLSQITQSDKGNPVLRIWHGEDEKIDILLFDVRDTVIKLDDTASTASIAVRDSDGGGWCAL